MILPPEQMMSIPEAISRWPVLRRLADEAKSGHWSFAYAEQRGAWECTALRVHPDSTGDIMRFRSDTDAEALRVTPNADIVWKWTGTLAEVLDKITDLPAPTDPFAPRLVLGRAPAKPLTARLMWPR